MANNNINSDLCKSCKICIDVCPCNIITENKNGEIYFIQNRESICVKCGQCMAVCSTKAIKVNGYSYEKDFIELPENIIGYSDFIDFLSTRRSVRNFKGKAVSKDVIDQILHSVSFAPYGAAPDEMEITVISDRSIIEKALPFMSAFMDKIVKMIEHPIARRIVRRKSGTEKFNTIKNHLYPIAKSGNYKLDEGDRITRGASTLIIFHANHNAEAHTNNSLIYATYAMMAAQALGLGTTMIEIVPAAINRVKEVREIFQIPKENEAVMSLVVGYPKYKYKRGIKRSNHKVNFV